MNMHVAILPSLTKRLAMSLGIFGFFISLMTLGLGIHLLRKISENQLQSQANQLIAVLAKSYENSMWNLEYNVIKHISETLILDRTIGYLEVREIDGNILFLWKNPENDQDNLIYRQANIVHNGNVLGIIRLGLNDVVQEQTISMILYTGGTISLILMLAHFLIGGVLITRFLKKQFQVLHTVSQRYEIGDYSTDVIVPYREFLPLMKALSSMGATITRQMTELRNSSQQLRAIITNAPIGIYRATFSTGQIVEANPTFAHMFGFSSREELLEHGMNMNDVYTMPESRQFLLNAVQHRPEGVMVEEALRRFNGEIFPAVLRVALQIDENGLPAFLDGTIEDISERKHMEDSLRASQEKFAQLFHLSPVAIVLSDITGHIHEVNQAFTNITGYNAEESRGLSFQYLNLFVDTDTPKKISHMLSACGQYSNMEMKIRRKDNKIIDCESSAQQFDIQGQKMVLTVLRDITESIRMQQMMVQTEKMLSIGGIAAGIAHEINNPLGIILQNAQNIIQRTHPDFPKNIHVAQNLGLDMQLLTAYLQARDIPTMIEDIQSAANRASVIIRHMLDFSRQSESRRVACRIEKIIDNALQLAASDYDLKKNFDFRRIHIERDYETNLPDLWCIPSEIEQVVLNLLRNAAQAMAEVHPPITSPRITIRIKNMGRFMLLEIEDNGPGIPQHIARQIFEPFFTTKPPGIGTGLGLSISYFIITRGHGGHINVHSSPGKGTNFQIEIPWNAIEENICDQKL
jgi:PAS domain S-box-containing protein